MCCANCSRCCSCCGGAMICNPMGRFLLSLPLGMEMAGSPAMDAGTVYRSARYCSMGLSWVLYRGKAVVGVVGEMM